MEVAPRNKVVSHHPSSPSTFTWKITNFSIMGKDKIYSDVFIAGWYPWRLLVFRKGNRADGLSLYLNALDIGKLAYEGNIPIMFSLAVINQLDDTLTARKDTNHTFLARECGWGFENMIPLKDLNSTTGFLVDDTCIVEVKFETLKSPEVTQEKERESKAPMDQKNGKQGVKADESQRGKPQERNEELENPSSQVDPVGEAKRTAIDFATLFEDIANVVGKAAAWPDQEEISKSLSRLKQLSSHSFSEITTNVRADLFSAFQVLVQATTLPSLHATAINDFFMQFGDLCESYDSIISGSRTAQLYFDTKDKTFESLKNLHGLQLKIRASINGIKNETETLQRRLRELEESRCLKLEEYAAAGNEASAVKAEWDGQMVNHAAMAVQRNKVENEMANAETQWKSFISNFK